MMEKKALASVKVALKKKFGANVLGCGEKLALRDKRVSSGSFLLDMALGGSEEAGFGFIIGRVHALWGEKSGGKTTTAYRGVGVFQGLCRNCWRSVLNVVAVPPTEAELNADPEARWSAEGECDCYAQGCMDHNFVLPMRGEGEKAKDYADRVQAVKDQMTKNSYEETVVAFVDAEDAFHKPYFENFGDPKRLLLVKPEVGEEASDIAHALVSSNAIDLMVLDSLAHFMPSEEVEKSAYDWQQGLQARIVNKTVRKMVGASASSQRAGRRLTQIWINQKRMNIGVMFGDPSVKPAGMGQDFAAHVEIKFKNSKTDNKIEQWGSKEKGEYVSTMKSEKFNFVVKKNKYSATKDRVGFYEQSPGGEVIEDKAVFKMVEKQLVKEEKRDKQKEKYWIGDMGFKTKADIMTAIQDPEVGRAIRDALLIRNMP